MKETYYEYTQNNSGGNFVVNKELDHRVFIKAKNEKEANKKAEKLGIYFNGCHDGVDCSCCGDRWCSPSKIVLPYRYGTFDKTDVEYLAKKYKLNYKKTTFKFLYEGKPDPNRYDLIFKTIKSYAKFLKDKYGFTKRDYIIHY